MKLNSVAKNNDRAGSFECHVWNWVALKVYFHSMFQLEWWPGAMHGSIPRGLPGPLDEGTRLNGMMLWDTKR